MTRIQRIDATDTVVWDYLFSTEEYQRTVQQYELRVGKHKFHDVPEEYLNVLEEGNSYAFHFVKSTKEILSAELRSTGS